MMNWVSNTANPSLFKIIKIVATLHQISKNKNYLKKKLLKYLVD